MTHWFNRRPGDVVAEGVDDPTMSLVGDVVPDWVRLPPELGSAQIKVTGAFRAPCPMCRGGEVRHLEAEAFRVAECSTHGFVWYRTKPGAKH
jgi:hypothetical protein